MFTVTTLLIISITISGLTVRSVLASRKIKRLERKAYFDKLTGALNRRSWDHCIALLDKARGLSFSTDDIDDDNREIRISSTFITSIWIVVFDLDHFKTINDNHGHLMGDAVLTRFSHTMQRQLRHGDIFARYGGEEFTALIHANANEINGFLNRLRIAIGELEFNVDQDSFWVTPSIGYVQIDATTPAKELLEKADKALYTAKQDGRDRVVFFAEAA